MMTSGLELELEALTPDEIDADRLSKESSKDKEESSAAWWLRAKRLIYPALVPTDGSTLARRVISLASHSRTRFRLGHPLEGSNRPASEHVYAVGTRPASKGDGTLGGNILGERRWTCPGLRWRVARLTSGCRSKVRSQRARSKKYKGEKTKKMEKKWKKNGKKWQRK